MMSEKSRLLFFNYLQLTANSTTIILVQIITTPLVANNIGLGEYGKLAIYLAYTAFYEKFVELSFTWTAARDNLELSKVEKKEKIFCMFLAQFLVWLISSLLFYFIGIIFFPEFTILKWLIIVGYTFLLTISFPWFFIYTERVKYFSLITIFSRILFLLLVLKMTNSSKFDDMLIIYLLSAIPNAFYGYLFIKKYWPKKFKMHIIHSAFIIIISKRVNLTSKVLTSTYNSFIPIFLGVISTNESVGLFAIANKYRMVFQSFIMPFTNIVLQRVAKITEKKKPKKQIFQQKAFVIGLMLSICLACLMSFSAKPAFEIFFKGEFQFGFRLVWILTPIIPIIYISNHIGVQRLILLGKEILVVKVLLVSNLFAFPSMIILCSYFDVIGATTGLLGIEVFVTLSMFTVWVKTKSKK